MAQCLPLSPYGSCKSQPVLLSVCTVWRRILAGYCVVWGTKYCVGRDLLKRSRESRGSTKCQSQPGAEKCLKQYLLDMASHRMGNACDTSLRGWATQPWALALLPERKKIWSRQCPDLHRRGGRICESSWALMSLTCSCGENRTSRTLLWAFNS